MQVVTWRIRELGWFVGGDVAGCFRMRGGRSACRARG